MRTSFLLIFVLPLFITNCQTSPPREAVVPAPAGANSPMGDAALRDTRWVPRQLAGMPVSAPADGNEPYLLLHADGTAEGNGSCNRFRGTFFAETPGSLGFGPLRSTRLACPALATEQAFITALTQTKTYRISGDTLRLLDAAGVPLAGLAAGHRR